MEFLAENHVPVMEGLARSRELQPHRKSFGYTLKHTFTRGLWSGSIVHRRVWNWDLARPRYCKKHGTTVGWRWWMLSTSLCRNAVQHSFSPKGGGQSINRNGPSLSMYFPSLICIVLIASLVVEVLWNLSSLQDHRASVWSLQYWEGYEPPKPNESRRRRHPNHHPLRLRSTSIGELYSTSFF